MNILLACFLTETLTKLIKSVFGDSIKDQVTYFISMFIGVLICLTYKVNIIPLGNFEMVNEFITGLVISRGANYVSDFVKGVVNIGKG